MTDRTKALAQIDAQQVRLPDDIGAGRTEWPHEQWWRRYGDAQLDALIAQALKTAPAMATARARVQAAGAQSGLAQANQGLLVDLTASVTQQTVSENGFLGPFAHDVPSMGATGPRYTEGTIGVAGHYMFDPWGRERAQVDAALGAQRAREAEAAQTELVVSAKVAEIYYDMQAGQATLRLLERARDLQGGLVAAHEARAARGLESLTVVEAARARKFATDRQISAAQVRLRVLREALRAMIGAGPDGLPAVEPVPLPDCACRLPGSLGYELLARRPDLQAMRWYVQSSMRQVDAAKAAFYPSFDIKAFFGFDALHMDDLLKASSRQMNIVPGLSLPIFDSGRLNAELGGARARQNVLIAQYDESVIGAVREVAQLGVELQGLDEQARIQNDELDASRFALASAKAHQARGLADEVTVLESNFPVLLEQGYVVELRRRQLLVDIALTQALGGGYRGTPVPGDALQSLPPADPRAEPLAGRPVDSRGETAVRVERPA